MLESFKISKLFGIYDYDIDFTSSENLKILIGPNGCGKTTILKMLEAILTCRHSFLFQYDFEKIELKIDNHFIELSKNNKENFTREEETELDSEQKPAIFYILDGKQ